MSRFGRGFQGNYTLMAQMPSRASVVSMEIDWINLVNDRDNGDINSLSVIRSTLTYVIEVWMNKETTAGAWLSSPPAPVPVSLELVSPLTLEEDPAIGLTAERLQQLLRASPSSSASCEAPRELQCNRLPLDLVFLTMTGADGAALPMVAVLQKVANDGLQPSLSTSCPEAVAALARQCMAYDTAERPSASVICSTLRTIGRELENCGGQEV